MVMSLVTFMTSKADVDNFSEQLIHKIQTGEVVKIRAKFSIDTFDGQESFGIFVIDLTKDSVPNKTLLEQLVEASLSVARRKRDIEIHPSRIVYDVQSVFYKED